MCATPSLFFSNSTVRDWRRCERLAAHKWCAGPEGRGLALPGVQEDLLFGDVWHRALPELWHGRLGGVPLLRAELEQTLLRDPAWQPGLTPKAASAKAAEWGRLFEGLVHMTHRAPGALPFLRARYEMVRAEGSLAAPVAGGTLLSKPDLRLRGNGHPEAWPGEGYGEYKSTKEFSASWRAQWRRNPQMWTGAIGMRAEGASLEWFVVIGGKKGVETEDAVLGKRRSSPLCWAYRLPPGVPTKVEDRGIVAADGARWRAAHTHALGWERTSTDDFPGGVAAWVEVLCSAWPELAAEQVCLEGPVDVEWDLVALWEEQQRPMVETMQAVKDFPSLLGDSVWMAKHFPQRFDRCETDEWGKRCSHHALCHDEVAKAEPLRWFVGRVPHHELETR